jgi:hypothetical protein
MPSTPVVVREMKWDEYGKWDEFVRESPYGTIFHTSDWLSICATVFGHKFKILGCFESGQLVAGCSFHVSTKRLFRIAESTFPTTPYGGILVKKASANRSEKQNGENNIEVLQALRVAIEKMGLSYVNLINSPGMIDFGPFTASNWRKTDRFTYYLDLDNFETNITKEMRWSIRKATENKVTAEKSNSFTDFFHLLELTLERQGKLPFASVSCYEKIFSYLQNSNKGELWVAKAKSGETCAAEIIVCDEKRAYRWSAASSYRMRRLCAPSFLMFQLLKTFRGRGFKEVDLVTGPRVPNVNAYLRQFRPRSVLCYCLEYKSPFAKRFGEIAVSFRSRWNSTT